jgi:hypothetical protein
MSENNLNDCKLVQLLKIQSERKGSLTPVYNNYDVPFDISRLYYLYDIPHGSVRGGHAHKNLEQLIIAVTGSFDLIINDSKEEKIFSLNNPTIGLYVPSMIWRELKNFSSGAICLVIASNKYDESDYIRDFVEYKNSVKNISKFKCH